MFISWVQVSRIVSSKNHLQLGEKENLIEELVQPFGAKHNLEAKNQPLFYHAFWIRFAPFRYLNMV